MKKNSKIKIEKMKDHVVKSTKRIIKNWWISLIIGIICIGMGVICFPNPTITYGPLIIYFIAAFFINGALDIIFAISNQRTYEGWGWTLAAGTSGIVFSIILILNPLLLATILAYFVAFWLMFHSFWSIGISIELKKYSRNNWKWLLVVSIIGVILSTILLAQPVITNIIAATVTSMMFTIYGVFRILLSLKLKTLRKFDKTQNQIKTVSAQLDIVV